MLPITFEGCNRNFGKPKGWDDEECSDLPAMVFESELEDSERTVIVTRVAYMPSKEDLEAFNSGRPLVIDLLASGGMVPISVFTYDENGEAN